MSDAKKLIGYSIAQTTSPFDFTVDRRTGRVIVPEGVPVGTELRYIERQIFSDGSYLDSDWVTFVIK